eukprot:UN24427
MTTLLRRDYGFNAYIVIRTSPGLVLADCYGACTITEDQEMRYSQIHRDTTFTATFEHEDVISLDRDVVIQMAMLYTPSDGKPLIRLHTFKTRPHGGVADVFRQIDLEAVMGISCKHVVMQILNPSTQLSIQKTLNNLVDGCINVLYSYRRHCAANSQKGQLILPETLKLMPLYTLGLLKCAALSPTIGIDERTACLRLLASTTLAQTLTIMYPNMYTLHTKQNLCTINERGFLNTHNGNN